MSLNGPDRAASETGPGGRPAEDPKDRWIFIAADRILPPAAKDRGQTGGEAFPPAAKLAGRFPEIPDQPQDDRGRENRGML